VPWNEAMELGGWICPPTLLENYLRQASGAAGYEGDYIALGINLCVYGFMLHRSQRST
jgi:hypothetical protein